MKNKFVICLLLVFTLTLTSCSEKSDSQKAPDNSRNTDVGNPFNPENPSNCLALDTDGDGVIDCQDPDIDNDGVLNEIDAFPKDKFEWLDSDGDGVGDNTDWAPEDPREQSDYDMDTIGDNYDEDEDNDGVPDIFEDIGFKNNEFEFYDIDLDGLGDNSEDEDADNDGVPDIFDDLFWNAQALFDIDNDLIGNRSDFDMDGDLIPNLQDEFPYDSTEWADDDLDRIGNNVDPDDDNDGFPDSWEDFPLNKLALFDSDNDGYSNLEDAFPYNSLEWLDSDGDGVGDNSDPFPLNPLESSDTDGDGLGDNSDSDVDNDGFPNCVPVDLDSIEECNVDRFPLDRFEWYDEDLDQIGDNADEDDDNDGIPDIFDAQPFDKLHFSDFDKDRIPDSLFPQSEAERNFLGMASTEVFFKLDADTDNDGVPNIFDDLEYDAFEYFDVDGDGIGNKLDPDDDGDGVDDVLDRFQYDPTEWADSDNDLIGDNIDADDDNDGVPDIFDLLKFNDRGFADYNLDEIPDNLSTDLDGDGRQNGIYSCTTIFAEWNPNYGQDIDGDNLPDAGCLLEGEIRVELIRVGNGNDVQFRNCLDLGGNDFELQQECFEREDYTENKCLAYNETKCRYPNYSAVGLSTRNDLYPWDNQEWQDWDADGLADNIVDEDNDNDGVPDIFDDFPEDNVVDERFRYFDSDGDSLPNMAYYFNLTNRRYEYEYINLGVSGYTVDSDSDNDLIDEGSVICRRVSDGLVTGPFHNPTIGSSEDENCDEGERFDPVAGECVIPPACPEGEYYNFGEQQCVNDPTIIVDGSTDIINCFFEKQEGLDFFPFNPDESSDIDGDRIGDNSDLDIDGDRQNNCIGGETVYVDGYLAINPNASDVLDTLGSFIIKKEGNSVYRYFKNESCDEDELPFVGRTNPFVDAFFDLDGDGFDTIPYCASTDCYYKNYDRDEDGLTDYEEYIFGSDPESKDTDGDLVWDIYERAEGTDPLDSNSFLDDDKDGIPNSIDPFPLGAFDMDSLLDQMVKSSSCRAKTSEELCEPNIGKEPYCDWVDDPANLIQNPEDPTGPLIPGKKCISLPIIVTKDIEMTDCVDLSGQVVISSNNNSKLYAEDFSNSVRCDTSERVLFDAVENSEIEFRDISVETKDVDIILKSIGSSVKFKNTAFVGRGGDLTSALDFKNNVGTLSIENSTLRTISEATSSLTKTVQNSLVNFEIQEAEIKSSILDCDLTNHVVEETSLNSGVYLLEDFTCVKSQSDSLVYERNILTTLGDVRDIESYLVNAYAMEHASGISAVFSDINIFDSAYDSIKITGSGISANPSEMTIRDRLERLDSGDNVVGNYNNNGTTIETSVSSLDYLKLFSDKESGILYCKSNPTENLAAYTDASVLDERLSLITVESFNDGSIDLFNPFGRIESVDDIVNHWNNNNDFSIAPDGFDSEVGGLLLSPTQGLPEGVSTRITGLEVGRKYSLNIILNALSQAKTNINMNVQLQDVNDASNNYYFINVIENESVEKQPITYDSIEKKFIVKSSFNLADPVQFTFRADATEMYLKINNNSNSERVYLLDVSLLNSSQYDAQILGAPLPVCTEDEVHLNLRTQE